MEAIGGLVFLMLTAFGLVVAILAILMPIFVYQIKSAFQK